MEIETDPGGGYDIHAYHKGIDGGPRWERSIEITCEECGTAHPEVIRDGTLLIIVCHNCENYWLEDYAGVFFVDQDTGEIRLTTYPIPFEFDGLPNRW